MIKKIFTILYLFFSAVSNGQDEKIKGLQKAGTREVKSLDSNGWKAGGTFALNINQGALSNWAAGGEQNTIGVNGLLNYLIKYKKEKNTWDNHIEIALGFQNASSFKRFRKIDDRIDITSKYGHEISKKWYYGILANFNSQALAGYNYSTDPETKISNFLSPGKILLSPGIDFKPGENFSLFVSPVTVRWVLKNDADFFNVSKFGVDSARKKNTEVGAFLTARYTVPVAAWATYTGRLDLFSNYKRNPQNVDILMTNLLSLKFTKIFAANISIDIIYDDDVIKRTQLKQILGIGLTIQL